MNKKEIYIEAMLLEGISTATKTIDELYKEIEEINNLPNDCTGIEIDGQICENKDYKIDILTNHYHVIGYMECLRAKSQEMLDLNKMNDEEFDQYLIEQEEIEEHNKKEMQKLQNILTKLEDPNFDADDFIAGFQVEDENWE